MQRPKQASPWGRWTPAIAAVAVVTVIAVVAMSGGKKSQEQAITGNPGTVTDGTLTVPVSTGPQVVMGTDSTIEKTHLTRELKKGLYGEDVKALQQRLVLLGFDTHGIDGQFGTGTRMAVWAFEGLVLGRGYAEQTGIVTDELWQQMQDPITFRAKRAEVREGATHVEIYLPIQVLMVFTDGRVRLITHISSGSGETWCEVISINTDDQGNPINPPQLKDICGVSKTPGGVFHFYRRYEGHRVGALGGMDNPIYFNYGIAVHGSDNVPNYPASHGCIRLPQWVAVFFPTLVNSDGKKGDRVYVWGLDGKEPEDYTKDEMLPVFNYPNPNSTLDSTTTTTTVTATTKPPATTAKPTTTTNAPPTTG